MFSEISVILCVHRGLFDCRTVTAMYDYDAAHLSNKVEDEERS